MNLSIDCEKTRKEWTRLDQRFLIKRALSFFCLPCSLFHSFTPLSLFAVSSSFFSFRFLYEMTSRERRNKLSQTRLEISYQACTIFLFLSSFFRVSSYPFRFSIPFSLFSISFSLYVPSSPFFSLGLERTRLDQTRKTQTQTFDFSFIYSLF